jgi:hypothetical protein
LVEALCCRSGGAREEVEEEEEEEEEEEARAQALAAFETLVRGGEGGGGGKPSLSPSYSPLSWTPRLPRVRPRVLWRQRALAAAVSSLDAKLAEAEKGGAPRGNGRGSASPSASLSPRAPLLAALARVSSAAAAAAAAAADTTAGDTLLAALAAPLASRLAAAPGQLGLAPSASPSIASSAEAACLALSALLRSRAGVAALRGEAAGTAPVVAEAAVSLAAALSSSGAAAARAAAAAALADLPRRLPWDELHPSSRVVRRAVAAALDDGRRSVRLEATRAALEWEATGV